MKNTLKCLVSGALALLLLTGCAARQAEPAAVPSATPTATPQVTATPVPTPEPTPEPTPILKKSEDVVNVLIVGEDALMEGETESRADLCMIVAYDRKKNQAKLISVMRDTWVPIEGHGEDCINQAYAYGGIELLMQTLNEVYDLGIEQYVVTGYDGFKGIIDQIGGLELSLTQEDAQYLAQMMGKKVEEGMVEMDSEMALHYARNLLGDLSDVGNNQRQKEIILAVLSRLKSQGDLSDYMAVINCGLKNVETNMAAGDVVQLGLAVLQAQEMDAEYFYLPYEGTWTTVQKGEKSVRMADFEKNKQLLWEFINEEAAE